MGSPRHLKLVSVGKTRIVTDRFAEILISGMGMAYEITTSENLGKCFPFAGNFTCSGACGMLHRGEADLATAGIETKSEDIDILDYSYPFLMNAVTFANRKVVTAPDISAPFQPFSFNTWLALILSTLAMTFILFIFLKKKIHLVRFWKTSCLLF